MILKRLQNKAGYISIETTIVAGLMIGLGAIAITQFYGISKSTTDVSMDKTNGMLSIIIRCY